MLFVNLGVGCSFRTTDTLEVCKILCRNIQKVNSAVVYQNFLLKTIKALLKVNNFTLTHVPDFTWEFIEQLTSMHLK